MSLETIYYVSQSIAVVMIFASLIFVGIQIHQNTLATRAASHHAISESLNEINRLFAENADLTRVWLAGLEDRNAQSTEEKWRFDSTCRAYMHVCETMFIQADLGSGDKGIMMAEEEGIKQLFSMPGIREWWLQNPYGFCDEFRDYVARITKTATT